MAFFGVTVGELNRLSVAVDICRDMQGIRPQRMAELGAFAEDVSFHSLGILFDHRQNWLLFQRILRTASCSVWPDGWASYLANIEIGEITKQRHGLHYQLSYWVMGDLHEFLYPEDFYDVSPAGGGRELFDSAAPNYSLRICVALTRMALSLFNDLCGLTNRLSNERAAVIRRFSLERHPLFAENLRRHIEVVT
jgi:hypothetical protein